MSILFSVKADREKLFDKWWFADLTDWEYRDYFPVSHAVVSFTSV